MGSRWVFSEVKANRNTLLEGPFPMRLRKRTLGGRVNADLTLAFGDERLTSYSGLELPARWLRELNFNHLLRESFRGISFHGDYGIVMLVRLFLAMLWTGGVFGKPA